MGRAPHEAARERKRTILLVREAIRAWVVRVIRHASRTEPGGDTTAASPTSRTWREVTGSTSPQWTSCATSRTWRPRPRALKLQEPRFPRLPVHFAASSPTSIAAPTGDFLLVQWRRQGTVPRMDTSTVATSNRPRYEFRTRHRVSGISR